MEKMRLAKPPGIWHPVANMKMFALMTLAVSLAYPVFAADDAAPILWTGTATNAAGAAIATITVDSSEAPDLAVWGQKAGEVCAKWYPIMCELLDSPGFKPYSKVSLAFKKDLHSPAATGRDSIDISANYVREHTNDIGMIVHELTHVVQAYPNPNPGWVTEGIADYVRISRFEPNARRPRVRPNRDTYHDAYKTTAMFFEWVEKKYDKTLVTKLNRAMREGKFKIELFKEYTGKTVDELWSEYIKNIRTPAIAPAHSEK